MTALRTTFRGRQWGLAPTRTPPNLIFVTQLVDPDDPVLGFVVDSIRAVARHCRRLAVVANEVRSVPSDLPAEVHSLGKEDGAGRLRRMLRYQALVLRLVRGLPAHGLFVHMCPQYLNLAAPIARASRVAALLWFAHPSETWTLRLAERLADGVLTSLPLTYPRPSPKVRAIGQGIDTGRFDPCPRGRRPSRLRLLCLGRTSPSKGYQTAVRAVGVALERGVDLELSIVGASTTPLESAHRSQIEALVRRLGLADRVALEGGVPAAQVPALLAEYDILVNTTLPGSGDKVVFEAMAAARPVVTSNPAFFPLLAGAPVPLWFADNDHEALAGRVLELAEGGPHLRHQIGSEMRRRVERDHSLDGWAASVVASIAFAGRTTPGASGRVNPEERERR